MAVAAAAWFVAVHCSSGAFIPVPGGRSPQPLIILFSIDTVRADHLSLYGYGRETTPALRALARDSILFTEAISQAANTAPAHMSLLTGLTPVVHGIVNQRDSAAGWRRLSPEIPTLAELLRGRGYATEALTNAANVSPVLGFADGFDSYAEDFFDAGSMFEESAATVAASWTKVQRLLDRAGAEPQPLFIFLHHYLCHHPYLSPPGEYRKKYANALLPALPQSVADLGGVYHVDRDFFARLDPARADHREHVRALYDGSIAYADAVVGELVGRLRQAGLYDRCLLVVTSDHGEEFQEHGAWGHGKLFRCDLHVPLLIKLPHREMAGRVITRPVRTMDVFPTLLALAGVAPPENLSAVSLLPLLNGGGYDPPLASYEVEGASIGVRLEEQGMAYFRQPGEDKEYLFDLRADSGEQHNLAGDRLTVLPVLRRRAGELVRQETARRARVLGGGDRGE